MNRVAIVGGIRTPFVKAGGVFARASTLDLSIHTLTSLVRRLEIKEQEIGEFVFSTVLLDPRVPNLAREAVIRSGLSASIRAHFVSNNCISGLVAANNVAEGIKSGRISSGIAGGAESMSRPALSVHPSAENFFLGLARAKSFGERLRLLSSFRPGMCLPQAPSPKEPSTGLTMGEHTEITAKEYKVSREAQDQLAFLSHKNAAKAYEAGIIQPEIEPYSSVDTDNLVRAGTTFEKLSSLKPVFDRSERGTLTAGNSSALTDGASAVFFMSEDQAKKSGREILCYLEALEFAAIAPSDGLLMAPAIALPRLLKRTGISLSQIDLFEIHEAFAAQVLANMHAWKHGWSKFDIAPIGEIPAEKINLNGGSIALGHPFAATGGRLLTSLAHSLKRHKLKRGVISVCAAGGMAAAALLTRD